MRRVSGNSGSPSAPALPLGGDVPLLARPLTSTSSPENVWLKMVDKGRPGPRRRGGTRNVPLGSSPLPPSPPKPSPLRPPPDSGDRGGDRTFKVLSKDMDKIVGPFSKRGRLLVRLPSRSLLPPLPPPLPPLPPPLLIQEALRGASRSASGSSDGASEDDRSAAWLAEWLHAAAPPGEAAADCTRPPPLLPPRLLWLALLRRQGEENGNSRDRRRPPPAPPPAPPLPLSNDAAPVAKALERRRLEPRCCKARGSGGGTSVFIL
jgi:hypothetical protein